jgi:hypothetical protein
VRLGPNVEITDCNKYIASGGELIEKFDLFVSDELKVNGWSIKVLFAIGLQMCRYHFNNFLCAIFIDLEFNKPEGFFSCMGFFVIDESEIFCVIAKLYRVS